MISGDAMKKELFYVAASRGRESVTVITSDKELLRHSVARSGERQSASELVRKIDRDQLRRRHLALHRGVNQGPNAAAGNGAPDGVAGAEEGKGRGGAAPAS